MRLSTAIAAALSCAVGLVVGSARADDGAAAPARGDAGELYDAAAAAYNAKDYTRAAELFGRADERAPNPVVLRLALGAALLGHDAVLAIDLAMRADDRPPDRALAELARRTRERF